MSAPTPLDRLAWALSIIAGALGPDVAAEVDWALYDVPAPGVVLEPAPLRLVERAAADPAT